MVGPILVILLIILSGIIAYLGDQIGMKVGKKRISIFGLRPRYSSIIITVITGMLIAVISLGLLLTTYSSLRQALFRINSLVTRLENLNTQVAEKDDELQEMQENIAEREEELERLKEQRDELEDENESLLQEREQLEEELQSTQQEFEETKENLKTARGDIDTLEKERDKLEKRIEELTSQRENLETEIEDLNNNLERVTEDYEEAQEMANRYMAGYYSYRDEDIVYQKGDIIHHDVLKVGSSGEEISDKLWEFLDEANEEARGRPVEKNEHGMALQIEESEIYNMASTLMDMEEGKRTIISLVADVNVSRGDWLWARFMYDEDFIVFEEGEEIVTRMIDTDQPAESIEEELVDLLNEINERAINEGLLPDTQGEVGRINFSEYYDLMNRLEEHSGPVRLKVFAREDIWRPDRLSTNINFDISRLAGDEESEE
ncbi:MAG: DUF3084 domain-containing protein [Bacillota bacterium]